MYAIQSASLGSLQHKMNVKPSYIKALSCLGFLRNKRTEIVAYRGDECTQKLSPLVQLKENCMPKKFKGLFQKMRKL